MTARMSKAGMNGVHTAGIYADMSVDGPEIGDLVVIIDKAKNLPNRKTIGKQDPYCAARLGKEAKKTETDKRGGQTPRWDQELRFTVHDSADYYQLKISVFNDDKKTDLIGDAWINLENVIVLGGGRLDSWHSLNYRGKFAGEIRLELTYYDIRPKGDKPADGLRDSMRKEQQNGERESLGGPRQLKQVKRRPLPADPTGLSNSPSPFEQSINNLDFDPQPPTHVTPESMTPPSQQLSSYQSPETASPNFPAHYQIGGAEPLEPAHDPYAYSGPDAIGQVSPSRAGPMLPRAPYTISGDGFQHAAASDPPPPPAHSARHSQVVSRSPVHTHNNGAPALPHSHSAPPATFHQQGLDRRSYERFQGVYTNIQEDQILPSIEGEGYAQYMPRHHSQDSGYGRQPIVSDEAAPPPPAHRSSGSTGASPQIARQPAHDQTGYPAPLKLSPRKIVFTQKADSPQGGQRYSASASNSLRGNYAPYQASAQDLARPQPSPPQGQSSQSDPRESHRAMPQSLMAGYSGASAPAPIDRDLEVYGASHARQTSPIRTTANQFAGPYGQPSPVQPDGPPYNSTSPGNGPEALRSHRSSAPIIKPRAVSPDPRTPTRKSVSPQPERLDQEKRLSGIPFSPDAYDTLNPSATSPSASEQGLRQQSPEHARDSPQSTRESLSRAASEGPIIGHDGRVIDPSDHLPSDTWAPEPEKKTPQKSSGLDPRSRPSPQGAQPMPLAGRRALRDSPVRPQSIATPVYAHNSEPQTPTSGAATTTRNRLQKRGRMQVSSPGLPSNSSPLASYDSQALAASSTRSLPRTPQADRVLRERENYLGGQSPGHASSPYGAGSGPGSPAAGTPRYAARNPPMGPSQGGVGSPAAGAGPPVPPKMPLATGREDYSALSDELRSIDIGNSGRYPRAARRSVY